MGPIPSPPNFNDFTQTFQILQQPFSQPKYQQFFDKTSTRATPGEQVMSEIEQVIEKKKN